MSESKIYTILGSLVLGLGVLVFLLEFIGWGSLIKKEGIKEKAIIKTAESRFSFVINGIKTADRLVKWYPSSAKFPYIWPDEGYKFIVINATLKNVGMRKEDFSVNSRLRVNRGYEYEEYELDSVRRRHYAYVGEYGAIGGIEKSLRPTESITGTFVYEILENTVPAKLIIENSSWRKIVDLTPYKIGEIKYEPAKVSITDYMMDSSEWGNVIEIKDITLLVTSKRKIPAIIKSVEVSVGEFQGKDAFYNKFYNKEVETASPDIIELLPLDLDWKGPRLSPRLRGPLIKPGVYTITFKILGSEGEILAKKSFSHHFKAE